MVSFATTRLSSKGQVVIPEEIRKRLGLKTGCRFVVVADKGGVIFRILQEPDMSRFDALLVEARRSARAAGLKKSDVAASVRRVRAASRRRD